MKRGLNYSIIILLLLLTSQSVSVILPDSASSQTETLSLDLNKDKDKTSQVKYEVNLFWLAFKTFFSLCLIIGAIYLILRYIFRHKSWFTQESDYLSVIKTILIGPNKYIQLVELLDRILVLGISEGGINLLTEITDKEAIDQIKVSKSKEVSELNIPFNTCFASFLKRSKPFAFANEYKKRLKYLVSQQERLKQLETKE